MKSIAVRFATVALILWCSASCSRDSTAELYAQQCRDLIGDVPGFDCAAGALVPITQNGVVPREYARNMNCDRPGLLPNGPDSDGQCVPYSRILDLSTQEAQISIMCRQKHIRSGPEEYVYDEIDVIAHNPASGATCWFQAHAEDPSGLSGVAVVSPTRSSDSGFWREPEEVRKDGCGSCHDNDPFMYSPFVGQVWQHVPANPFGPYYHVDLAAKPIGFDRWPTQSIEPRDSTCTGCHRIGISRIGSCDELSGKMTGRIPIPGAAGYASSRYPGSHAMPPGQTLTELAWDQIHAASVAALAACCGDNQNANCELKNIPRYP